MHQLDQSPALLQYTVTTDPTPVNVSTADSPVSAKIIITVKANPNILCDMISFQIPIGDAVTDMYRKDPIPNSPQNPSQPDWSPSQVIPPEMGNNDDSNLSTFLFKHTSDDKAVKSDVTFYISGTVNNEIGVSTMQIHEHSTLTTDNKYMVRQKPEDINKAAEEAFFLKNIRAVALDSPNDYFAVFEKYQGLQLQWESNGDYFRVFLGKDPSPVSQGTGKVYVRDMGLHADTTFIVQAQKDTDKFLYQEYIVKVDGEVAMLGNYYNFYNTYDGRLDQMKFNPNTDGLVIMELTGHFDGPPDNITVTLTATSASFTTGVSVNSPNNTITVPIKKDDIFFIRVNNYPANTYCILKCYWMPMGKGTLEII